MRVKSDKKDGKKSDKKCGKKCDKYVLLTRDEAIREIRKRHLYPVRLKDARGFITIADVEDYYENSYPVKSRYEQISWSEFFRELKNRGLVIVQYKETGFIKIVRKETAMLYVAE